MRIWVSRPFPARKSLIVRLVLALFMRPSPPPFPFGAICARATESAKDSLIVHYVSTRGAAPTLGFADALLAGLARDGGLYAPLSVPHGRRTRSGR